MSPSAAAPAAQYLSFFLAGEEYAAPILQLREILAYGEVTRVPGAPAWIRGVANLRGSVLPIIDLGMKLGLPPSTLHQRSCVVVVEVLLQEEKRVVGVLVDAIGQVLELGPQQVEPPPAFGTPVHASYLMGLGRADNPKFILLLDMERVLNTEELRSTGAVLSGRVAP